MDTQDLNRFFKITFLFFFLISLNILNRQDRFAALVAAIGSSVPDFSELGRVVEDCRDYMGAIGSLHMKHVFRETNCVAHPLAHIASHSSIDNF